MSGWEFSGTSAKKGIPTMKKTLLGALVAAMAMLAGPALGATAPPISSAIAPMISFHVATFTPANVAVVAKPTEVVAVADTAVGIAKNNVNTKATVQQQHQPLL